MDVVPLKQGYLPPYIAATILDSAGAPVNLTGATIHFRLRPWDSDRVLLDAPAILYDADTAEVRYVPEVGDFDYPHGALLRQDWPVTFLGDNGERVYPGGTYLYIHVMP